MGDVWVRSAESDGHNSRVIHDGYLTQPFVLPDSRVWLSGVGLTPPYLDIYIYMYIYIYKYTYLNWKTGGLHLSIWLGHRVSASHEAHLGVDPSGIRCTLRADVFGVGQQEQYQFDSCFKEHIHDSYWCLVGTIYIKFSQLKSYTWFRETVMCFPGICVCS